MKIFSRAHRTIDLKRVMVDGNLRYQTLCQCGFLSEAGSRAMTERHQKLHRKAMKTAHWRDNDVCNTEIVNIVERLHQRGLR